MDMENNVKIYEKARSKLETPNRKNEAKDQSSLFNFKF